MKQLTRPLLAGLLASLAAALPRPPPAPPRRFRRTSAPTRSLEAVSFASLGTSAILFTDWAAMKAAHGMEDRHQRRRRSTSAWTRCSP